MHFCEGLALKEIAATLGKKSNEISMVKSRIKKGILQLPPEKLQEFMAILGTSS